MSDEEGRQDPEPAPVEAKIANRNGLTVGELVAFLQTQDQALPVAATCGCGGHGGWSSPATAAYLDSFTAVNNAACVKVGWGGNDD